MLMLHLFFEALLTGVLAVVAWALLLRLGRRIGLLLPARRSSRRKFRCVRRLGLPDL